MPVDDDEVEVVMMPDLDVRGVGGRGWLGHHLVNEVEPRPAHVHHPRACLHHLMSVTATRGLS